MINMSLILYQMEQGVYAYAPGEVDIAATIRTIEKELAKLMRISKVSLSVCNRLPEAGHSEVIPGDRLLCYSMFSNLIKNAIEAAPRGSTISLTMEASGDGFYEIAVHNFGMIPEEVRESFARKFATSGKRYGTGLGAYSARLIAEHMKGRFSWSSSEAEGTRVCVSLPQGASHINQIR
jgi:signal transduction histidine kinase